jgi:hypothetical protein
VGSTNRPRACFGKAEVPHLADSDQILHGARNILDRHLRVDTVLIEQIDRIDLESLQRGLRDLFDVLGPAVQASLATFGINLEPELGGDHHLAAEGRECLSHERASAVQSAVSHARCDTNRASRCDLSLSFHDALWTPTLL